jgi:hypothetical protein
MRRPFFLTLLILLPTIAIAHAGVADVAEDDPGLFMVMMIMLLGFLCGCIMILALMAIAAVAFAAMALAGVFTFSALVAWYRRSLSAGLKTFIYGIAGCIGLAGGAFGGWLYYKLFNPHWPQAPLVASTSIIGCVSALLCTRLLLYLLQHIAYKLTNQRSVS